MRQYIGTDIIEIARIERAIVRWGQRFLHRVYTESELKLYRKKLSSLAARFAGKEAVIKAFDAPNRDISWREIEILSSPNGRPLINLYGKAQNQANSLGLERLDISFSHSREYAIAFVVGEARRGNLD